MSPIRLLQVDDHALFREGLAGLFAHQPDFAIVGEADDAGSALAVAGRVWSDLVLMDIDLPGQDGVEATRRLKTLLPATVVVMVTACDDADRPLEAFKARAQGYLIKNIRSTELLDPFSIHCQEPPEEHPRQVVPHQPSTGGGLRPDTRLVPVARGVTPTRSAPLGAERPGRCTSLSFSTTA